MSKKNKKDEKFDLIISESIQLMNNLWNDHKSKKKSTDFPNLSDDKKINLYIKKYSKIWNMYPFVCRYMICMDDYNEKSFKYYLHKRKNTMHELKNYSDMDDWLCRRRADYLQLLWKYSTNKNKKKNDIRNNWRYNYNVLKKETNTLNKIKKNAENKIQKLNFEYKKEKLFEFLNEINNIDDANCDESIKQYIEKLNKLNKLNKTK